MIDDTLKPLIEYAVWVNLDRKKDLELILLKGHLILERILDSILEVNNLKNINNFSFHSKIRAYEKIEFVNSNKKDFIVNSLLTLNKIRNRLAHDFDYKIDNGEFEQWSKEILINLKGEKFSKYTYRTKIIHSFSIISKNILECKKHYR